MTRGYPRLLGDIGGTHARWAWQEGAGTPLTNVQVVPCDASASLYASAESYLTSRASSRNERPKSVGIGIATAVNGDEVRMTNHPWAFSISKLKASLGVERCLVINDFTALALSLPTLDRSELDQIGAGVPLPGAPIALLGPGTGLGVSGLVPSGAGHWSAISGEGGHVTLAPADDEEFALLASLRAHQGHVSAEDVLSGPGLLNLYRAVCDTRGMAPRALLPQDITNAANAGSDPACRDTVSFFSSFLGSVAGNLALTLGARGGLYIGGGVVPGMGAAFDSALFRKRFESKGRFRGYLEAIPSWVITAKTPALTGVSIALDEWAAC
jgi:glucokinase